MTPELAYKRAVLGLHYAGFPSYGGSARLSRLTWTTYGFFVGISF